MYEIDEVLKIFNYKFDIVLERKYLSPYPKLDIYTNNNFYHFLEYNNQKYGFIIKIYKNILFEIGISELQLINKNNEIIEYKTTIDDYYNIKNEFLSNKEYIVIKEAKKEMKNNFGKKSITLLNNANLK